MRLRRLFPFLFLFSATSPISPAAQTIPDEEVVVTANAHSVPFENLSRSVTVLTREEIAALGERSIPDILAHAASADIGARGPFGMQADIRLRGSAFSQVLVLVDGMRINDAQTGHHNADFPVSVEDIERVEVLLGAGSSIYGADAFGGAVNIVTRPFSKGMRGSASAGRHGFLEGVFAAGFEKGRWAQSITVSGNRSSGFRPDRDFRGVTVNGRTHIGERTTLMLSHANKEFGAEGFYGPAPSREWTNQTLISFSRHPARGADAGVLLQGFYRTHGDRFLYDRRTPRMFESRHRTHAAGLRIKTLRKVTETASVVAGAEGGGDWMTSSSLGDHSYGRASLFAELRWKPTGTAVVYPGVRVDAYTHFGTAVSPSLSAGWWALPCLRLRAAAGKAFRIPTFTELHYRDPNHEADPGLRPERAWSAEAGGDWYPASSWMGSLTFFARRERGVIDWIRSSAQEKWRTANIHRIETAGMEVGLTHFPRPETRMEIRYSLLSSDAGAVDYISKYALDYARHSGRATVRFPLPFRLACRQSLSYKRRADGRSYWLLDNGLERAYDRFSIGIDFTNLLDARYQEVRGIDMPGRWFTVTLRVR